MEVSLKHLSDKEQIQLWIQHWFCFSRTPNTKKLQTCNSGRHYKILLKMPNKAKVLLTLLHRYTLSILEVLLKLMKLLSQFKCKTCLKLQDGSQNE